MEEVKVGKISIPIIKGEKGEQGLQGPAGKDGLNGYSPVKGVDYFTPDEIEDVTGEVTTRAKENLEYEFRENLKDISYDNTTGILTFTRYDGTTVDVDLPLELIVSSGTYNDTTKEIELTLANGQLIKIPLSDLIDDFYVKAEIDQKVDTINGELTNLKTEDSELQKTLTNQATKIEELEEQNKQLLKDYKPIPFNSSSNHLQDTGELPMPISINGGIEQDTREGYNVLDLEKYPYSESRSTLNGGTVEISNGLLKIDGTNATATATAKSTTILKDNPNASVLSAGSYYFGVRTNGYYISDLENIVQFSDGVNTLTDDYILTQWFVTCSKGSKVEKKLLISNDTSKTTYEQYGSMPSLDYPSEVKGVSGHYDTVVENRNRFNINKEPFMNTDAIKTIIDNGFRVTSTTNGTWRSVIFMLGEITRYKGKTVRVKAISKVSANNKPFIGMGLCDKYGNNRKSLSGHNAIGEMNVSLLLNPTENQTHAYLSFSANGDGTGNTGDYIDYTDIIVTIDDTNTEYIEHQEQNLPIDIPFNMYSGKPYKENGKWYRPIEFEKYVFTGNEYFLPMSATKNKIFQFQGLKDLIKKPKSTGMVIQTFSNHFKGNYSAEYVWGTDIQGFGVNSSGFINIGLGLDSEITTNTELQAKFKELYDSGKPVYVILPLANPTREKITDTTLIAQLEELQKAHSYKEVTNINSYKSSEDVADLVLSGNALMSNDIRLSKLENAVLSIGGNV